MALTDTVCYVPGTGFIYLAPSGTVTPASLTAPAAPWENMGHTSQGDGLTITRDGGDSNILGTWQNPALRERRDPVTFAITLVAHQVDNTVLGLYFGGGDTSVVDTFGVNNTMFVRIVDGNAQVGLYLPKVSIASDDDMAVDPENLLAFPLRATVLQQTGSNLMNFIADQLGA
jgi:hypothetical protein